MIARVVRRIDSSIIENRIRKENQRKTRERFNANQDRGFRTTIGDLSK